MQTFIDQIEIVIKNVKNVKKKKSFYVVILTSIS